MPYYCQSAAYNEMGEHERAKKICTEALESVSREDYDYSLLNRLLQQQLGIALAALGESDMVLKLVDKLIERHAVNQHPLAMSLFHETRAMLAIGMRDRPAFKQHLQAMRHYCGLTRNPAMLANCERVAEMAERVGVSRPPPPYLSGDDDVTAITTPQRIGEFSPRIEKTTPGRIAG